MGSSSSSTSDRPWPWLQIDQFRTPRLAARRPELAHVGVVGRHQRVEPADQRLALAAAGQDPRQRGVLLAVADRVEAEHGRLAAAARCRRTAGAAAAPRRGRSARPRRRRRPRRTPSRGRAAQVAHLGQPDVVGVRVEDDHAQTRRDEELLEDQPQRVGLAGAGLAAHEGVPVEPTGVQRGRDPGSEQQVADRQRGATGRTRDHQASTSSGAAGRARASWKVRPSRRGSTPSPRARRTVTRDVGSAPGRGNSAESGRSVRTWPRHAGPSPLEDDVAARLQREAVQRGLEA